MELTFVTPEKSGWRGPGAPRKQVPDHIVEMLCHARDSGQIGILDIRGDTEPDIAEATNVLRAGARHMGHRITIQRDRNVHVIRFRIGEALE